MDILANISIGKVQKLLIFFLFLPFAMMGQLSESQALQKGNERVFKGELSAAMQYYELALLDNPESAQAFNNIGNIYHKMGLYFKAVSNYTKAIKYDTANPSFFFNRALTKYAIGGYAGAAKDLEKSIELDSKNSEAFSVLALCYSKQSQFELALTTIANAIAMEVDNSEYYETRAEIRLEEGELHINEAIADINKAIELDDQIAQYFLFRAELYEKIGNKKQAKQDKKVYEDLLKAKGTDGSHREVLFH